MTVFISHSSRDGDGVTTLVEHIDAAGESVWLDQKLSGGQAWWDEILSQIRSCTVFVFALSNNSRTSKPCQAELEYAKALGLPILPVQIGETDWYLIDPVLKDVIDYRTPNAQSSIKLVTALRTKTAGRSALPDPLPEPPPVPYEYLQRLGVTIESPETLPPTEQARIVMELRSSMVNEADASVVKDIRHVLRALRRRPDATFTTVGDIDQLLAETAEPAPPAPVSETTSSSPAIPQPLVTMPPSQPAWPPAYQVAPPSQPSMPSWTPPPPPPPNRGNGKWIALGAGGIALAAIVGVVIWLVVRPDSSKDNASSTSTTRSTTTTSTRTSTSTAPANPEERFLSVLAESGITWPEGKEQAVIDTGHAVCTDWENGATLATEADDLRSASKDTGLDWTDFQIGVFIGAATGAFCPEYMDKLKQ